MKPDELLYAKTHEWVHTRTDETGEKFAVMGISAFAVEALTDLVYIELPEVGREVRAGESISEVESVKAVSDIYAPLDGQIVEVNDKLSDSLEVLSDDPYGDGWIAKIRLNDEAGLGELMDHTTYQQQCEEEIL